MAFHQTGGCQCGMVRYEITARPRAVYCCHCTVCQTQSGAAFGMAAVMRKEHLRITQGEPRSFLRVTPTGRTNTCWFYPDCGTRLYNDPGGDLGQENRNLKPGTLDDTTWLRPTAHFWTRSAQPWVAIPEDALRYEGTPMDRRWLPDWTGSPVRPPDPRQTS